MADRNMRKRAAAAALAMTAALAGCDSSTGSAAGGGGNHQGMLDACPLLTLADAGAALGKPVDTAQAGTLLYMSSCYYRAKPDSGSFLSPHIFLQGWTTWSLQNSGYAPQGATAAQHFANLRKGAIDSGAVAVPGVGDGAFWWRRFGQFWFLAGDVEASIVIDPQGRGPDSSDDAEARAKAAALKAISRL